MSKKIENKGGMGHGELTVFFDATEDIVHVVGEETLCIEHGLDHACNGTKRHVLRVRVAVPLRKTPS